jgi:hypothetical protein
MRVTPSVQDALEFAKLADKRWRYYRKSLPFATSMRQLQSLLARHPDAEISVVFIARGDWFSDSAVIGFAQCRRTYCHHLILEFLATHPRIIAKSGIKVTGIGAGLVCALAEVAGLLGMKAVWGEATRNSAPFYTKLFSGPQVTDHFFIQDGVMDHCRRKFRDEMYGCT